MIVRKDIVQGTTEWENIRLGIPTASRFDELIQPKKLEPSTQAVKYRNQLVAEWLLGYPIDWGNAGDFAQRGTDMESEARDWYELLTDYKVEKVGFILRDDGKVGGSPDSLVNDDGLLEIKCPAIHTHIGHLLEPSKLVDAHRGQVQGYLYLTDRDWCDIVSYHPTLPPVRERVARDPKYILALDNVLTAFIANLDAVKEQLREHKQEPARPLQVVA